MLSTGKAANPTSRTLLCSCSSIRLIPGEPPVEYRIAFHPFAVPILLVLGALNAWTTQAIGDYAGPSTALCLGICAAGLFGEDLLQRGYRLDRAVIAHVATRSGAATRRVARAVGAFERVVVRSRDRLTDEGPLVLVTDGVRSGLRSYRLAS